MPTASTPTTANGHQANRWIAAVLSLGCLLVAAFQAALTLGAPFGAAALGGANAGQLPGALRVVTALATIAWLFAALIVLSHQRTPRYVLPNALVWWGTRGLAGLLAAGTLMNLASSSPWERYGWAPFTLIMFILCIALIRNGANGRRG